MKEINCHPKVVCPFRRHIKELRLEVEEALVNVVLDLKEPSKIFKFGLPKAQSLENDI